MTPYMLDQSKHFHTDVELKMINTDRWKFEGAVVIVQLRSQQINLFSPNNFVAPVSDKPTLNAGRFKLSFIHGSLTLNFFQLLWNIFASMLGNLEIAIIKIVYNLQVYYSVLLSYVLK